MRCKSVLAASTTRMKLTCRSPRTPVERLTDRLQQRELQSAADASSTHVEGSAGIMDALLARIAELEKSFADSTIRVEPPRKSITGHERPTATHWR